MNLYTVVSGGRAYVMPAPNLQAASQFVRHRQPGVRVERITDLNVLANAGVLTNPAHILQHLTGIDCGAVARQLEEQQVYACGCSLYFRCNEHGYVDGL